MGYYPWGRGVGGVRQLVSGVGGTYRADEPALILAPVALLLGYPRGILHRRSFAGCCSEVSHAAGAGDESYSVAAEEGDGVVMARMTGSGTYQVLQCTCMSSENNPFRASRAMSKEHGGKQVTGSDQLWTRSSAAMPPLGVKRDGICTERYSSVYFPHAINRHRSLRCINNAST